MTTQEMEARVRMELSRLSACPSPADRFDLNAGGQGSAGQSPQAGQTIIDRFADISSPPQPAESPQFLSPEEKALISDLQVCPPNAQRHACGPWGVFIARAS
jgi:hypothetical protein